MVPATIKELGVRLAAGMDQSFPKPGRGALCTGAGSSNFSRTGHNRKGGGSSAGRDVRHSGLPVGAWRWRWLWYSMGRRPGCGRPVSTCCWLMAGAVTTTVAMGSGTTSLGPAAAGLRTSGARRRAATSGSLCSRLAEPVKGSSTTGAAGVTGAATEATGADSTGA